MPCIDRIKSAQGQHANPSVTPEQALAMARERFFNLCNEGIKPRKYRGTSIDPDDVATAMAFLGRCRKTRKATTHTCDLVPLIGVPLGAIIAGAVGLGLEVQGWRGIRVFEPGAMMNVSLRGEPHALLNALDRSLSRDTSSQHCDLKPAETSCDGETRNALCPELDRLRNPSEDSERA